MLFDRLWTREKDRAKLIDWRRHRLCLLLVGFCQLVHTMLIPVGRITSKNPYRKGENA